MKELRQFEIFIRHPITKNVLKILADGKSVTDVLSDAQKVTGTVFRPKSDGVVREPAKFNVTLADGTKQAQTLAEYESGKQKAELIDQPGN